jgi:hypothetical protein
MFWSDALSHRCSFFADSFLEDQMVNSISNRERLLTYMAPSVFVKSHDATSKNRVTKEGSGKKKRMPPLASLSEN